MKNCASSSAAVAVVAMGWKPSLFGFDIAKSVCIIFPTSNQLSPPAHPPSSLLPPSSPSYSSLRPSRPRALRREMSLSLSAMSYGPLSARHQWLKSSQFGSVGARGKAKKAVFLRKSLRRSVRSQSDSATLRPRTMDHPTLLPPPSVSLSLPFLPFYARIFPDGRL